MADWSDMIGLTIEEARERAKKSGHAIAATRIGTGNFFMPSYDISIPTLLVTIDHPFKGCKIVETHGVNPPTTKAAKPKEAQDQ